MIFYTFVVELLFFHIKISFKGLVIKDLALSPYILHREINCYIGKIPLSFKWQR
nr:MAG TPA: hypothetical protein [Caudoviricetes sp.]